MLVATKRHVIRRLQAPHSAARFTNKKTAGSLANQCFTWYQYIAGALYGLQYIKLPWTRTESELPLRAK